jgi:hypothetical protein
MSPRYFVRPWLICITAILVAGIAAACASNVPSSPPPSRPTIHVSLPPGKGAVEGGILRCYDLATPPVPQFQAGTVAVYRGAQYSAHQVAVTSQVVDLGGEYVFVLPPGDYVLVPDDPTTNIPPPAPQVTVASGRITMQDLQYGPCI